VSPFVHVAFTGASPPAPPTYPTIVATDNSFVSTADTTHTIDIPGGSTGDLLITFFQYGGSSTTVTQPSGWTNLGYTGTTNNRTRMWYREAADGSSGTVTASTSSTRVSAHITYRISGYGAATYLEGQLVRHDLNAGGGQDATVTPSWGSESALWIAFAGARRSNYAWVQPTGYGSLIDRNQGSDFSGDVSGCRIASAHRELTASSETILAAGWTYTGAGSPDDIARHGLVAIRPA
jgi:hypothetical protein